MNHEEKQHKTDNFQSTDKKSMVRRTLSAWIKRAKTRKMVVSEAFIILSKGYRKYFVRDRIKHEISSFEVSWFG